MFHDPLTGLSVRFHAGWAYDADTSDLTVNSFLCWNGDKLTITPVAPTVSPAANDEEWILSGLQVDAWSRVEPLWTPAPAREFVGVDERLIAVRGARLDLNLRWVTLESRGGAWPFRGLELPGRKAPTLGEAEASIAEFAVNAGGRELEYLARRLPSGARRSELLAESLRRQVDENALDEPVSAHHPALAWALARRGKGVAAVKSCQDSVAVSAMRLAAMRLHDDLVVLSQAEPVRVNSWEALCWCLSSWFGAALVNGETAEVLTTTECLVAITETLRQLENTPAAVENLVEARLRAAVAAFEFGGGDRLERASSLLEAARSDLRSFPATHPKVGHARLIESSLLTARKQVKPAMAALERARLAVGEDPALTPLIEAQEILIRALRGEAVPSRLADTTEPDILIRQAYALLAGDEPVDALDRAARGLPTVLREMAGKHVAQTLLIGALSLRETDPNLAGMLLRAAEGVLELRAMSADSEDQRLAVEADPLATAVRNASVDLLFTAGDVRWGVTVLDRARGANLRSRLDPAGASPALLTVEHVDTPPLSGPPREQFRIAATFVLERIGALLAAEGGQPFMDPSEIQQLVDDVGQQILVVHPVEDRVAMVLLEPNLPPVGVQSPGSRAEIDAATAKLRAATVPAGLGGGPGSGEPGTSARQQAISDLWGALIEPLADRLVHRDLIISPSEDFALIPFAALGANGDALIERVSLSIVPSLGVLAALRARRRPGPWPRRAYVVGDPTLTPELLGRLGSLPYARSEAERLEVDLRSYEENIDVQLRLGPDATEESYRMESRFCDLLHLACHAQVRVPASESPLFLASHGDDGLLAAYEVERIPMNGGLAFLSACETAAGRASIDGVLGLSRSYLIAGADTVVASLWRVNDLAAATIARHFYAGLFQSGMSVAQALRHATLATREDLRAGRLVEVTGEILPDDPLLWAAHIATGDASLGALRAADSQTP